MIGSTRTAQVEGWGFWRVRPSARRHAPINPLDLPVATRGQAWVVGDDQAGAAVVDNLDSLARTDASAGDWGRAATNDLVRSKIKSLNFMRGRTFLNKFVLIDEAQNLTPELLPGFVSVTLSAGARRMAQRGVNVRHLGSIQNLGSIDVLCTDKTGTPNTNVPATCMHVARGPDEVAPDDEGRARLDAGTMLTGEQIDTMKGHHEGRGAVAPRRVDHAVRRSRSAA